MSSFNNDFWQHHKPEATSQPVAKRAQAAPNFADQVRAHVAATIDKRLASLDQRQVFNGNVSMDLQSLVDALESLPLQNYGPDFGNLVERLQQLRAGVEAQTEAIVAQTKAIAEQTRRLEAAARSDRTVTYDASGRVTKIKIG